MKAKAELVRIVRAPGGGFEIDHTGKRAGRGAYVCALAACAAKAQKSKGFERSYKGGFPKEIYAQLQYADPAEVE